MPEPKLCDCGCGRPTNIAKFTDKRRGVRKGDAARYLPGHSSRTGVNQRGNDRRSREVDSRRERVREMYEAGSSYLEIAAAVEVSKAVVNQDVRHLRSIGGLGYRNPPLELGDELAAEIEKAWNEEKVSVAEIGRRFGWRKVDAQTVVMALRRRGANLPRRHGEPVAVDGAERRAVKRAVKKRRIDQRGLSMTEQRKVILRLLASVGRPIAAAEIHAFLASFGDKCSKQSVRSRLENAEKAGLVARAKPEIRQWFERGAGRWFIPIGAEQSTANLTLADAERETELAALIEAQEAEEQRGEWTDSEKGHWADKSIDAPLTADGFTILDTLGDEDEALSDLMEGMANG